MGVLQVAGLCAGNDPCLHGLLATTTSLLHASVLTAFARVAAGQHHSCKGEGGTEEGKCALVFADDVRCLHYFTGTDLC